jgi:hypothetical protein
MSDPATLAASVRSSGPLILRFLDGFDDDNRTRQAPGLPNHVSWTLGHLALTMHHAADFVTGFNEPQRLSTSDWIHGDGTAGDPSRYDTESVAFGSAPVKEPAKYPADVPRGRDLRGRDRSVRGRVRGGGPEVVRARDQVGVELPRGGFAGAPRRVPQRDARRAAARSAPGARDAEGDRLTRRAGPGAGGARGAGGDLDSPHEPDRHRHHLHRHRPHPQR